MSSVKEIEAIDKVLEMLGSALAGFLNRKFGEDVVWNIGSLGFLVLAGVALNVVIGRVYGPAQLGLFNIAYALYIFLSQISIFGLHLSVMKYSAEHHAKPKELVTLITSGLGNVIPFAVLALGIAAAIFPILPIIFDIENLQKSWIWLFWGLPVFAVNKYMLGVINGLRWMRSYAFLISLRYVLITMFLLVFLLLKPEPYKLTFILVAAEIVLFLVLAGIFLKNRFVQFAYYCPKWRQKHLSFGVKAALSGTVVSLTSRSDVLIIGAFLGDVQAGIYSVAVMVFEGLGQIGVALRNNANPVITRLLSTGNPEELRLFIRKMKWMTYPFMLACALIAMALYPTFLSVMFANEEYGASYMPLIILLIGMVLRAGYMPFHMLLVSAGYPGYHTIYIVMILVTNVVLNLALIPIFGISGSAAGTALAWVLSTFYLNYLTKRTVGIAV